MRAPSTALRASSDDRLSLWEKFQSEPYRFSFHQSIHICAAVSKGVMGPSPFLTPYQIKSHVYLAYPPSDIHNVTRSKTGEIQLTTNILSIAGVQGPLPLSLTEHVLHRVKYKDFALQDFLDLFNHRLSLLYHHTVSKHRLAYDHKPAEHHPYGQMMQSLLGEEAPQGCLRYTSLFWHKPRSWKGLEVLLSCDLNRSITVSPYRGGWAPIPLAHHMRLNREGTLNTTKALGSRVWQQAQGVTVHHPITDLQDFDACLPHGAKYQILRTLIYRYIGEEKDIHLVLDWGKVKPQGVALNRSCFLNWSSFLATHPCRRVRRQTTLRMLLKDSHGM